MILIARKRNYKSKNSQTNNQINNPSNTTSSLSPIDPSEEQEFQNYASTLFQTIANMQYATNIPYNNGFINNPIFMNQIIKQLTATPQKYSRDVVLSLIASPHTNEKALKDLHQFLLNTSQHYKRLINYFATLLTFDYYIVPTNADEEDMKTNKFKKSYDNVNNWLENFNIKKEFIDIMKTCIGEDAGFYYLRSDATSTYLQRMPTDYCMIVNKTELGYQYAFNMMYFFRPGINIDNYAPEFKEYYDAFIQGKDSLNTSLFWKVLDPDKGFVFKWDENDAGIILPMMGLFLDAIEITEFKSLLRSKVVLENWKILFQKIPMREDKDAKPGQYLLSQDDAAKYHSNIKGAVPAGVSVLTTPMNVSEVSMSQAESRTNIVGVGEQNFYSSSGSAGAIFGESTKSAVGLTMSGKVDESFVTHMLRQFERFINYNIKKISGKYRFKLKFLESTIFNRDELFDRYLQGAQFGFPKTLVAASLGMSLQDLVALTDYENSIGLVEKLKPLLSSHTAIAGDNKGGAPKKKAKDLTDGGAETIDAGSNDDNI